jgi:DNA polymerase-4
MYQLGIFTGVELKVNHWNSRETFWKIRGFYYNVVLGIHNSEVKSDRITKSVAAEHTFDINLSSEIFMMEQLENIANTLEKV